MKRFNTILNINILSIIKNILIINLKSIHPFSRNNFKKIFLIFRKDQNLSKEQRSEIAVDIYLEAAYKLQRQNENEMV